MGSALLVEAGGVGTIPGKNRLRFGAFELDLAAEELRAGGSVVRLQRQPLRVLALLAASGGRVVGREEIQSGIWGGKTFVDFDQGLNFCIRQIRTALADDPSNPKYIQTLARRGYRFVAPVEDLGCAGAATPARLRLAVLPLRNLTGDPAQEYLSDGLTEEMITQLGRLHPERLGVISRTSAMRYKNSQKGADQIGRELAADYLLEGSARSAGSRVRVAVQLIRAADQAQVWAGSYDRELRDILALESEVARAVAAEIRVKLTPQQVNGLQAARPVDPEVYQLYLKGRYWWNRRTEGELQKSLECFQKTILLDPEFALAYTGLADAYMRFLDDWALQPRSAIGAARAAAGRALKLNPNLAEVHTSMGHIELHELACRSAEQSFRKALDLNPGYSTAYYYYANCLAALGRFTEALEAAHRALDLDPVSATAEANLAGIYYFAGQPERSIEHGLKALDLEPNSAPAHQELAKAYEEKKMYHEAVRVLTKAASLSGRTLRYLGSLGRAHALAGERAEAVALLEEISRFSRKKGFGAYGAALIHCALGNKEQAVGWIETAFEERSAHLPFLRVDPRMRPLASEPGFRALASRIQV
jgi:TolB-like protein/Tfp pilus assembly protein PilF